MCNVVAKIITFRVPSCPFLQRKNGLFKKAYELGVLCSVDVAVIIFGAYYSALYPANTLLTLESIFIFISEERPGHEVKLHTYSSSDLRDIVQRQIRVRISGLSILTTR